MNEEVETTETVDTPVEQAASDAELSLSEHEQQFAAGEKRTAFVDNDGTVGKEREAGEQPQEDTPAPAAQQARDKETGQFKQGRRRAKSHQASADDVPRIRELTRQLRERDEELARLRTPPQPSAVTQAPSNGNGHPPAVAQATPQQAPQTQGERFQLPASPFDPEPRENDPKYGGDAFAYMRDVSRWEGRQAVRQAEFDRMVATNEQQQREAQQAELRGFAERVDAAKAKYEDFEEVALQKPTPIQKDSIIDIFINRHRMGAEMLYYLQHDSHQKELDGLLKMPEFDQVEFLTLLSQRLSSNGHGLTGAPTTSVPGTRTIVLPPKPPNVVRTEAQRASGGIPTDRELSLSEHENYYRPKQRR